jgi:hypothetical protein
VCVCVCVCVCVFACECVCVRERESKGQYVWHREFLSAYFRGFFNAGLTIKQLKNDTDKSSIGN